MVSAICSAKSWAANVVSTQHQGAKQVAKLMAKLMEWVDLAIYSASSVVETKPADKLEQAVLVTFSASSAADNKEAAA